MSIALWKLWKSAGKLVSGLSVDVLVAFHLPRLLIGARFCAMYGGKLPRSFGTPVGIGDVVVGVLCVVGSSGGPRLRRRRVLWWWNVLGLLDILAVVIEGLVAGTHDPESMGLMAKFPLSMLPTWYVPLVIVTHRVLVGRLKRSSWATAKSPMLPRSCAGMPQNRDLARDRMLPAEHSEERFDIRVGADVAVAVEVGGAAGGAAVAREAGEEGIDVGVGAEIAVAVEVGGAAGEVDDEGLFPRAASGLMQAAAVPAFDRLGSCHRCTRVSSR